MKKETFCRYIRQYETDMFRFAKSIVGTQADGEDAMQESILKAYENIDTLRSRRKFKAWRNFKLYFKNAKTASGSIDLILL